MKGVAGRVILFDEVQTLPPQLAVPTLAALSRLAERYGATVVFSTATKPAFAHLDARVREYAPSGWQPREIAPPAISLFVRARRTDVTWDIDPPCSWEALAEQIARDEKGQALCIVNLKRHAQKLFKLLKGKNLSGLSHLSTNMCPAHREKVLRKVRCRLNADVPQPCRLISTQCVEAGVDVDFPVVYRALGPLDSIAQAAGRCNRNGKLERPGEVRVFLPEFHPDEKALYPPGGYEQAANVTQMLLKNRGAEGMDINDPVLFDTYYKSLYGLTGNTDLCKDLEDALQRRSFVDVAGHYRLINQDAINILVPYDLAVYQELREQLEKDGRLTRKWVSRARPYTISLFRPKHDDEVRNFLEPAPLGFREWSDDWFIYLKPEHYKTDVGLLPPQGMDAWMV